MVAHARRGRRRVHHGAARGRRGDVGDGERGARVPRVQRAVAPPLRPTARPGPWARAPLDWYFNFGIDTPAQMYSLWFRRYMDEFGATNEDFGRYTVVGPSLRRHQPERVVLRASDHARRPPGVALDRGAGAPALRLLPGERRRSRARRDARRPCARRRAAGRRSWPPPTRTTATASVTYELLPRRPRDLSRGRGLRAGCCSQRAGLTPADIDVAELYENFSPIVFLVLEAFGFCGPRRGE